MAKKTEIDNTQMDEQATEVPEEIPSTSVIR